MVTECVYVHGFASGPSSTKAKYFSERLRSAGLAVHVPDMNGDNFSDLTLTNQLEIINRLIKAAPSDVLLIGSSMGGLLSVLAAKTHPSVKALVLLAPGFGLNRRWDELLGPESFANWQKHGAIDVFHHAAQKNLPLKFTFIQDAQKYQTDNLKVTVPTLVMHGVHDDVVPVQESLSFAKLNPDTVELHQLDSDHALIDKLPEMWQITSHFLHKQKMLPAHSRT